MKNYWAFILFVFLAGCNESGSDMTEKKALVRVELHKSIQETLDGSPIEFSKECMAGLNLCWYKINKSASDVNLPGVVVKNSNGTLDLKNATDITIVVDDRVGNSVENIDVVLRGLPDNSSHEKNRDFIYLLINDIKLSGWHHYFSPSSPRISGSQADKIDTPETILGHFTLSHPWLDPDYKVDIARWLKISLYSWYFYNDGAYLHLSAWRRDSKDDPKETGTYLISLEFMTEREYWVAGFSEDADKARWKELLPARLKNYQEARQLAEDKARAAGIEIDETYKDPPIQALSR
ncbi:hypothetical protein [Pseudomonas kitaguniensis]|uniref:hypothetical protein n=1 Tax=Pseudomonas kitaguniensis TaxID=2607908 RepID=UPI003D03519E